MIRLASLVLFFCLSVTLAMQSIVQAVAAPAVTVGKLATSEGQDFATRELGQPWDMSAPVPYPDYPAVFQNFNRNSFSAQNGSWTATTSSTDPNVMIFVPNYNHTQQALKLGGDRYNIDASKYKLLSMRICVPTSGYKDVGFVFWYVDLLDVAPTVGLSNAFPLYSGCHVYTIDLSKIGTRDGPAWGGTLKGLRIKMGFPGNLNIGPVTFQFDWIRLTTASTGTQNQVPIGWSNITTGTNINFYLNTSCSLTDATLIGQVARGANSSGTFNWGSALLDDPTVDTAQYGYQQLALPLPLPESFQPGQYTVLMQVDKDAPVCAGSPLEIRSAPILNFQKPSMTSGPDYATTVAGNPWDMSDAQDVMQTQDITGMSFVNGILNGIAGTIDPGAHLNVPNGLPIDASKYHYMTFHALYDATAPDGVFVTVMRFLWWYRGPTVDPVTTKDLTVHEGWQTYSFDLRTAPLEPATQPNAGWNGLPTTLRYKAAEPFSPMPFHVDYVTLSGDEIVRAGTQFPLIYQLNAAANPSISFYYDTDRNPSNGRTAIVANPQVTAGRYKVYVPLAIAGSSSSTPPNGGPLPSGGQMYIWDTTNIPNGTYYIAADVSDGVNAVTWYSEVPVTIYR